MGEWENGRVSQCHNVIHGKIWHSIEWLVFQFQPSNYISIIPSILELGAAAGSRTLHLHSKHTEKRGINPPA